MQLLRSVDGEPMHDGGHEEKLARGNGEAIEGGANEPWGERRRHEVSLLDLPRGRVHRKGKKSTTSAVDGDFEFVGRKHVHAGKKDQEWEMETVG